MLDVWDIDTNTGPGVFRDLLDVIRPPGPLTRPRAGSGRRHTFGVSVRNLFTGVPAASAFLLENGPRPAGTLAGTVSAINAIDSRTGVADLLAERAASGRTIGEVALP